MRALVPYISLLMVALQLLTCGFLGPRMVCTDSDGTQSIEWAALSCCMFAPTAAEQDDPRGHEKCCAAACGESRDRVDSGPVVGTGDCGCVDEPAAENSVVRQNDSRQTSDLVAVNLLMAVLPAVAWPEPTAVGCPEAFLPPCHAPPREHIATIVLRI